MELNSFLRDLRTLATLERSGLEGRMETVDPAELLRSVADEHAEEAVARNHEVEVEAPPGLPPFQAVPRLLHEAIANFHSNAIKYTPEGGRIVLRAASERGWVRLEVEDNGIGVSQEGQQRLFREFVRLRKEDERLGKVAGTGLGLSIVRRIIEAHGGRVGVESREGEGSRFYAELPARQAAGAQERPAESG
jgi:signal transduction histidine kinase